VIDAADPTSPARFVKQGGGEGEGGTATLRAVQDRRPKIAAASIKYISVGSKFVVPRDAMVLLMDRRPADKWPYLLLYIVLAVFILANLAALAMRLRDREEREEQGRSSS
jgi:hypothetical protein